MFNLFKRAKKVERLDFGLVRMADGTWKNCPLNGYGQPLECGAPLCYLTFAEDAVAVNSRGEPYEGELAKLKRSYVQLPR